MISWRIVQFIALLPLGTAINRVLVQCFQGTMGSYNSKEFPASACLASEETSAWALKEDHNCFPVVRASITTAKRFSRRTVHLLYLESWP